MMEVEKVQWDSGFLTRVDTEAWFNYVGLKIQGRNCPNLFWSKLCLWVCPNNNGQHAGREVYSNRLAKVNQEMLLW